MPRRISTLLAGIGGLAATALVLVGCATTAGGPASEAPEPAPVAGQELPAAWLDAGRLIGVVTEGSSTCIPVSGEPTYADGVLTVEFSDPEGAGVCTADMAQRVTLVGVPTDVDPAAGLEVVVTGEGFEGFATLPAVDGLEGGEGGTDYLPSAGWTSEPGMFAFLSWGSSTCKPVVQDASASGDAEITVTFAEPAADQMCTMDMAPRADLVVVPGFEATSGVHAVLVGAEFDNVRIPIIG